MLNLLLVTAISLSAASPSAGESGAAPEAEHYAQVVIQRRVIIRVPTEMTPPPRPIRKWKSKKGPKCLPGVGFRGAVVMDEDKVDLLVPGGSRIRAELESSCPALDYYSGFYLRPDPSDGKICAGRDAIHARSGGECLIKRFRYVFPVR